MVAGFLAHEAQKSLFLARSFGSFERVNLLSFFNFQLNV
jgi:hypothetical protein